MLRGVNVLACDFVALITTDLNDTYSTELYKLKLCLYMNSFMYFYKITKLWKCISN